MSKTYQVTDTDYIHFLAAAYCDVSCLKAADCYSKAGIVVSHDKFNRFLTRQSLTPETLWTEGAPYIERRNGWLVLDDTVIDKIHSEKIETTQYQWNGKQRKVVNGIGLVTLVWTDGTNTFPVDYRIYDIDCDGKTKNDHLRDMLQTAKERGFNPYFVMFDSWYSEIDNLKLLKRPGWNWFTRVKKNRMVNPDRTGNVHVSSLTIPDDGIEVHLRKYGFIRAFHSVNKKEVTGIGPQMF